MRGLSLPVGRHSVFALPVGSQLISGRVHGYYIDLTSKAVARGWPPPWFPWPGFHRFMAMGQWGLGSYERYLNGEGEAYLAQAAQAGEYLIAEQETSGRRAGAWLEPRDYPHTFQMRGPWASAMAQGQCASLLVRLFLETGVERFALAARSALRPLEVPTQDGGVQALLDGRPFPEEYPTRPPSLVLNGAIYALWGVYDVSLGLDDDAGRRVFNEGRETLTANLHRWDTGHWSRYDLYPHPLTNVASFSYHALHINQLRAFDAIAPGYGFADRAARFEGYGLNRFNRARAYLEKVAFRVLVPRNRIFAGRMPWGRRWHG
jgi:hypothetical protein